MLQLNRLSRRTLLVPGSSSSHLYTGRHTV